MEKDSFIFRREWKDAICGLPDKMRLQIYEAIIEYGTSGEMPVLDPMAMLAFNFTKAFIDKDKEKYKKICEKRSSAAKRSHYANAANAANAAKAADNDIDNDIVKESSKEDKKKNSIKKVDAADAAARLGVRKEDFYNLLIPYVTQYGKEMIRAFFDYWSEPNKSMTKMRFELERTWDISRRLSLWASRENQFGNRNGTVNRRDSQEARAKDAADIIKRLAETNKPVSS